MSSIYPQKPDEGMFAASFCVQISSLCPAHNTVELQMLVQGQLIPMLGFRIIIIINNLYRKPHGIRHHARRMKRARM